MSFDINDITFKKAETKDFDNYLKLRSEESNVFWTGYVQPPSKNEFLNFYLKRLFDNNRKIFFAYHSNELLGSFNLDIHGDDYWIGYSVFEKHRNKGVAQIGILKLIELVTNEHKRASYIHAWVNEKNSASVQVLKKTGFYISSEEVRFWHGNETLFLKFSFKLC